MSTAESARPDVELRVPAEGAFVSVLRTLTAGLAARLDFTMDDIEDLRIAVGEACALVLEEADPDTDLTCGFHLSPGRITIALTVESVSEPEPRYESFAWQVLTTLASEATTASGEGRFTVRLSLVSGLVEADA